MRTDTRIAPRIRSERMASQGTSPGTLSNGFTLVEVLVALIVFAIGVLSIATLMPLGSRSIVKSADQTRGSELISGAAERLLTTSYSDSTLAAGAHTDPANPFDNKYYVRWNVEEDQPMVACKRVTVTAGWPSSSSPAGASVVIVIPRSGG